MTDKEPSYSTVWARPPRPARSTLSREQIVSEALRLLDAEGIDGLSMRRLGVQLGVGATSIYWHVASRDELIELVIDEVYGELEVPDPEGPGGWRAAAEGFAHSVRATIVGHPWSSSVLDLLVLAGMGPNQSAFIERMLAVLDDAGFDVLEAERALNTVSAYAFGVGVGEAALVVKLARSGQSAEEAVGQLMRAAEAVAADHPQLGKVLARYRDGDAASIADDDFHHGLECVLDGLQARLDSLRAGKRPPRSKGPGS